MALLVCCPDSGCRWEFEVSETTAGEAVRCPHCARTFLLKGNGVVSGAPQPSPNSGGEATMQAHASSAGALTPELLDWARRQFSEEEIVGGLRELRKTGGLQLRDFVHELEEEAARRE